MSKMGTNSFKHNNLQTDRNRPDASEPKRKRGRPTIDYPATTSPTILDIGRVAEFYDGEGNIAINSNQLKVNIPQNDREKLDWIRCRFGGKIYGPYIGPVGNNYYQLIIVRERALGFMFTIFTFLSQSRREQFKAVLDGKASKRAYQATISDEGISEAYLNRNIERSIKRLEKHPQSAMSIFGVKK